jgi:hypothetical protein
MSSTPVRSDATSPEVVDPDDPLTRRRRRPGPPAQPPSGDRAVG